MTELGQLITLGDILRLLLHGTSAGGTMVVHWTHLSAAAVAAHPVFSLRFGSGIGIGDMPFTVDIIGSA